MNTLGIFFYVLFFLIIYIPTFLLIIKFESYFVSINLSTIFFVQRSFYVYTYMSRNREKNSKLISKIEWKFERTK